MALDLSNKQTEYIRNRAALRNKDYKYGGRRRRYEVLQSQLRLARHGVVLDKPGAVGIYMSGSAQFITWGQRKQTQIMLSKTPSGKIILQYRENIPKSLVDIAVAVKPDVVVPLKKLPRVCDEKGKALAGVSKPSWLKIKRPAHSKSVQKAKLYEQFVRSQQMQDYVFSATNWDRGMIAEIPYFRTR